MGQISVGLLVGGVITSGLVIGRLEMGQVFLLFGAYAFVMTLCFGDTGLWPLVFSASGHGHCVGWVYSWVCSSNQEESYLEWLGAWLFLVGWVSYAIQVDY